MSVPKRISYLMLACLFTVLFAACGGSESDGQSKSVSLTMWTWKLAHVPGLQAIAKEFETKTGIKVKISAYNPDEVYRTKVTTAAQSDDLPDILSYWSSGQFELGSSGILTDLTDKVDDSWKSSFLPGTFEKTSVYQQTTYDSCQKDEKCTTKNVKVGQAFSVPYLAGQAMFVYGNKSLMQQAGLDPNTPPKTAEEWLQMMKTVKEKTGKSGLVVGAKNGNTLDFWLFNPLLMTSCGQEKFDAIYNGKESFTTPCAMRVFQWMESLAKEKLWTPDILQTDIDPADVNFSQDKAAFDIGGTYTLGFLLAQGMDKSNIVSFPVPALKDSAYPELKVNAAALIDAGITKDSQHPKEALDFLKFLTSKSSMETFAKTNNDLPAVKIDADPAKVGPVLAGLISGLSDNSPFIKSTAAQQGDTVTILSTGLQQIISGEMSAQSLAEKVEKTNQDAWKKHGA